MERELRRDWNARSGDDRGGSDEGSEQAVLDEVLAAVLLEKPSR